MPSSRKLRTPTIMRNVERPAVMNGTTYGPPRYASPIYEAGVKAYLNDQHKAWMEANPDAVRVYKKLAANNAKRSMSPGTRAHKENMAAQRAKAKAEGMTNANLYMQFNEGNAINAVMDRNALRSHAEEIVRAFRESDVPPQWEMYRPLIEKAPRQRTHRARNRRRAATRRRHHKH